MADRSSVWLSGTHAEQRHAEDGVDAPNRQWNRGGSDAISWLPKAGCTARSYIHVKKSKKSHSAHRDLHPRATKLPLAIRPDREAAKGYK